MRVISLITFIVILVLSSIVLSDSVVKIDPYKALGLILLSSLIGALSIIISVLKETAEDDGIIPLKKRKW